MRSGRSAWQPACVLVSELFLKFKWHTVKPRYSVFQGTGQNYALKQGSLYCQHINNYENTLWDQNLYALLAGIRYKRVRYSRVLL